MSSRNDNQTLRNDAIRRDVKELTEVGVQMKLAISVVAEKYYLSEATVRGVVYDKRRK
jgi:predicted transcriptional regulator YheO